MKQLIIAFTMAAMTAVAQEAPMVPSPEKPGPGERPAMRHRRPMPERPGEMDARRRDVKEKMAMRGLKAKPFGKLSDGRETKLYTLQGLGGLRLDITDYGGRLVRCYAPDKHGNLADVTLGFNTAEEYEKNGFSMGTLIGRYGNRIKDGKFTLEGKEVVLACNETTPAPRHCNLHGGPKGWDSAIWDVRPLRMGMVQGLELTYVSKDGEMGFPGTVTCKVKYLVLPNNVWRVDYEATTDKPTVINPTHHSYWNLAGESSGSVLGQLLQINADEYTQTDAGLIPVKNVPVKDTGFDFTVLRPIGAKADWMKAQKELAAMDNWYDHNFALRGKMGELRQAVIMKDPVSGRKLEIWTTEPAMQMYGAQNMDGTLAAKAAGTKLVQFAGVALETQHYPDSPNHPEFPTTELKPGETFKSTTEYRFSAE